MGRRVRVEWERVRGLEAEKGEGQWDENTRTAAGEYVNDDGLGEPAEVLYGVNYQRLLELKEKFDPENRFDKFVDFFADRDGRRIMVNKY